MIAGRTIVALGLSQLISWGISFYLVGVFGARIGAEFGWSPARVHGGVTAALLVMGLASAPVGRLIDRHGGRPVLCAGALLMAASLLGLAACRGVASYYAAWLALGLAMRLSLYDAAFAALARIGGAAARRPIAQITLLGGLASSVFWPLGNQLAEMLGWRGALVAYAGFALLTLPLHLALPRRPVSAPALPVREAPAATTPAEIRFAGLLYAGAAMLTAFVSAGISTHLIGILAGLGLPLAGAVWLAATPGVAQSLARLAEVTFGRRLKPLSLNLIASALLPVGFAFGLLIGGHPGAALLLTAFYGAGNGLLTIARGTLPLALFDPVSYGARVGRLLAPAFLVSAMAPLAYALVIDRFGPAAALLLSCGLACIVLACAVLLSRRFGRQADAPTDPRP